MTTIVKVQFRTAEKLYDFNANGIDLSPGDKVIVETERGKSMAMVATKPAEAPGEMLPESLKPVLRKATYADLEAADRNAAREKETFLFCQAKIGERNLDMKLVKVEYLYDGSKAVFFFTADGRIDFRDLVKDLAQQFHTRIEMRQIGVRDEAKMVGGIGICGRELCCSSFLRDFAPVSVKMAKEQNLALNPTKISGQCGRLLCCLGYEFDTYCELRKGLPKCGKHIKCGNAEGEVIKVNTLKRSFTIKTTDSQILQFNADELQDEAPPLPSQKQAIETASPNPETAAAKADRAKPESRPRKADKDERSGSGRRRHRNRNKHGGDKGKPEKPKETP